MLFQVFYSLPKLFRVSGILISKDVLLGNNPWLSRFRNQLQPPEIIPIGQCHSWVHWASLYHYLLGAHIIICCVSVISLESTDSMVYINSLAPITDGTGSGWCCMLTAYFLFTQMPSVQCDFHTLQWDINTVAEWVSGNHSKFNCAKCKDILVSKKRQPSTVHTL